jgi:3,4-dihydroxy 2-butanone 4-phosphate synthase/GTP cyclohydrolase II
MEGKPMQDSREKLLDNVADALTDVAAGRFVIVVDDERRENEGDLIVATDKVTPEHVNMMLRHACGLICVPMAGELLDRLGLKEMAHVNRDRHGTAFTVSVDAIEGATTGISAYDRWLAAKILGDPKSKGDMLAQPGHMFPLRARPNGVFDRPGHTEATVDLARLAGLNPAGLCCEILNEDGSCARLPQLLEFKKKFGYRIISVQGIIAYRREHEGR